MDVQEKVALNLIDLQGNVDRGMNNIAEARKDITDAEEIVNGIGVESIAAKEISAEDNQMGAGQKPWRKKKKATQTTGTLNEIEIYEGKVVAYGPSFLEISSPESGYLRIICKDESEFVIPYKVVECFQCIDVILHSDAVFKEKLENVIRFPDIRSEVMESVLRFAFIEHVNRLKAAKYWGFETPRLVFQFEVDQRHVMDLIHAAHFLGIKDLLNVTSTMVARHFGDVPDVSTMPTDLAWCVAEQFTAQELFDAEERPDFLSLSLETGALWAKHCKKFLREDIINPVAPGNYPSYESWVNFEGPPPLSWKSLYIALELQQLADRQDGGSNDSFFVEVAYKGKCAYTHTIRPMFWDWVLSDPASLPFFSYTAHFSNLLSLNLVKLDLGTPLVDGSLPCLVVGDILQALPFLQHLDLSETGFTTDAAIHLSKSLQNHSRLQVLRLAYNLVMTEGFCSIVQTFPFVRTLKFLDVRGNGITVSMAEDAVAAIQLSSLEELLLDGNLKANKVFHSHLTISSRPSSAESEESRRKLTSSRAPEENIVVVRAPILSVVPAKLRNLRVSHCELMDADIQILAKALLQHSAIQVLDISDNKITSVGGQAILLWLQDNKTLVELSLANNNITDSFSAVLITTLLSNNHLEKLSLKGNSSYGEESLPEIIIAAVRRGRDLLSKTAHPFLLDFRSTDISHNTRGRILRQKEQYANELHLLI